MQISEINEIKFCMLITPYTILGRSNYSGITIDLLKNPQYVAVLYCPKIIKKLATVLQHF